jgi:hypothetical protein
LLDTTGLQAVKKEHVAEWVKHEGAFEVSHEIHESATKVCVCSLLFFFLCSLVVVSRCLFVCFFPHVVWFRLCVVDFISSLSHSIHPFPLSLSPCNHQSVDKKPTETKESKVDISSPSHSTPVHTTHVDHTKLHKKIDEVFSRFNKNSDDEISYKELKAYFDQLTMREIRHITTDLCRRDRHRRHIIRDLCNHLAT